MRKTSPTLELPNVLTATGEIPNGSDDHTVFGTWQGEYHVCPVKSVHLHFRLQIIELSNGNFIASPTKENALCAHWSTQYPTRQQAIRKAIAMLIVKARLWRHIDGHKSLKNQDYQQIIQWAFNLINQPPPPIYLKPIESSPIPILKLKPKQIELLF